MSVKTRPQTFYWMSTQLVPLQTFRCRTCGLLFRVDATNSSSSDSLDMHSVLKAAACRINLLMVALHHYKSPWTSCAVRFVSSIKGLLSVSPRRKQLIGVFGRSSSNSLKINFNLLHVAALTSWTCTSLKVCHVVSKTRCRPRAPPSFCTCLWLFCVQTCNYLILFEALSRRHTALLQQWLHCD